MSDPQLLAENISKHYGTNQVLRGVSLSAQAGQVVSIIGSSGSGKSTFLRCLNLLEQPSAGRLQVAGQEIALEPDPRERSSLRAKDAAQLQRLRTQVAMVFQHFNLWAHMTALENVMEAPLHVLKLPHAQALERARHYLDKVGVRHREAAYPAHLSGGEQQRVSIARALAMEPAILLFDEPTSALDPELVNEVLRVMQQLASEGRTMLVVTHEIGFARDVSHQVMFLHQGKAEEAGPPQEVLLRPQSQRLQAFLANSLK